MILLHGHSHQHALADDNDDAEKEDDEADFDTQCQTFFGIWLVLDWPVQEFLWMSPLLVGAAAAVLVLVDEESACKV